MSDISASYLWQCTVCIYPCSQRPARAPNRVLVLLIYIQLHAFSRACVSSLSTTVVLVMHVFTLTAVTTIRFQSCQSI